MDCWRRCVAHVVGYHPDDVPDFVKDSGQNWVMATAEWLAHRGRTLVAVVPVIDRQVGLESSLMQNPVQTILVGVSGANMHAVVKEATGTTFDPGKSNRGLKEVRSAYFII